MNKKQIWEKIKEREYDFPNKDEVFQLIEENIERIEFVKDHIGLRDILFLSEKGTETFFSSTLFAALDIDAHQDYTIEENEQAFMDRYEDDVAEIIQELKLFFVNNDRPLFIGIGFIETTNPELRKEKILAKGPDGSIQEITQYDIEIIKMIHAGKATTYQEASKQLRVFPEWYEKYCKMPEEVKQLTKTEEEELKEKHVANKKKYLMELINQALDEQDEEQFTRYAKLFKDILIKQKE